MAGTTIEDMEAILRMDNEELLMDMARVAVNAFNNPKQESESESEGAQAGGEHRSPQHCRYRIRTSSSTTAAIGSGSSMAGAFRSARRACQAV